MADILESGAVAFLYRPRVEHDHVAHLDDVARLYLVLRPQAGDRHRRIIVGRKSLPPSGWAGRRHGWAYVDAVERPGDEQIADDAEGETYETKTRGERTQPEDRPLAEGAYALVREGDEVHLVVQLDHPERLGPAQEAFALAPKVAYSLTAKDPARRGDGRGPSAPVQAQLPPELQARFEGRRSVAVDPPELLDHVGLELLLMPVRDEAADVPDEAGEADLFAELGLDLEAVPTAPLEEGKWA